MDQRDCDFSPLKLQLIKTLESILLDVNEGLRTLKEDRDCVLDKLENIKDKFENAETLAASFYLNCYLSPFTDKYLDISTCIQHLSAQRHGALIVVERKDAVDSFIRPGTLIDAALTHSLLESIFYPGNPLHDGAVVIRSNHIFSAANILPLSSKNWGEKKIGTRHRSAIGLTELCDAVVLVVSEETGKVSFAADGSIHPIMPARSFV